MYLLAHTGGGSGANPVLTPWEIHPILVHFPIAFLLAAVVLTAYAWRRGRIDLERVAVGLFGAGIATGYLAAAAGLLAFFTVPDTHTEQAHTLMYWHLGLMVASMLLFTVVTWQGWRDPVALGNVGTRLLMWLSAILLVFGGAFGGYLVYHGGTGIDANLLKPGLHEEHHGGHPDHETEPPHPPELH